MRERRFKKSKKLRKVFLVICEGETEKEYVEYLKKLYRLPITIKTRVSGNRINSRLVNQYLVELGLGNNDDYSVIYIYDADIRDIIDRLSQLQGKLILTNPCMELWYLLHTGECSRHIDSDQCLKCLKSSHQVWNSYIKGYLSREQMQFLSKQAPMAIERSRKLRWRDNPSTNMGDFIDMLENEKKC